MFIISLISNRKPLVEDVRHQNIMVPIIRNWGIIMTYPHQFAPEGGHESLDKVISIK